MRLLVLGGTAWLGRHLVMAAQAEGHEVACLARGESGTVPSGAALIRADRNLPKAYAEVVSQRWDAVIDVSRQPGQVRDAAAALAGRCSRFVFVSSTSVYADASQPGHDETAAVLPALQGDVMEGTASYGSAKVACERHVLAGVGQDRALIVRAGLIGGPGDETDRTGYWPIRFARATLLQRSVLVPDTPQLSTQLIDVRDLAGWIVGSACNGVAGTFNAVGEPLALHDHLQTARAVAGFEGQSVAADPDWLLAQGVAPWMGPKSLPLWLPIKGYAGFGARDGRRAVEAGLQRRPLSQTLTDVLAWERSRQPLPAARKAGLSDADEGALLQSLERVS